MLAYQIAAPNEKAQFNQIDVPLPGPHQIRVSIHACGLNFADLLIQNGNYQDIPTPPFTLGMEISGVVNALGESVDSLKIGDRVAIFAGQGGLAEQGVFDANRATRIPDGMSSEQAAAFPGVGLTAVEIGKLMGATVIAHARGAEKLAIARAAGADHLVDDSEDLRQRVLDLGGADVVYDAVGGDAFRAAFRACNPEARLIAIGFASGDVPQIPANHLMVKNLDVIGFYIGGYMKFRPDVVRESMATLMRWFDEGRLQPHISHSLPLDEVEQGWELLRERRSTGKVVIRLG